MENLQFAQLNPDIFSVGNEQFAQLNPDIFSVNSEYLDFEREGIFSSKTWDEACSWFTWLLCVGPCIAAALMPVVLIYALYLRYANRYSVVFCTSRTSMKGKTVLITSNPTGIGLEIAKDLAHRGARVILACKEVTKAHECAASLDTTNTECGLIIVKTLDTSSLRNVSEFADEILQTENRLDVLMLTANIGGSDKHILTNEGLELTMATNHFGHFLLLNRLLGILKSSQPSRVVFMVTSATYLLSSLKVQDLNFRSVKYDPFSAYAQSMACNLLVANNLAHLTAHSGISVNSMCPGMMASLPYARGSGILQTLYRQVLKIASRTPEEGAQTLIHLAVAEEVSNCTGTFFVDCKEREMPHIGLDSGLAKKVWERCEDIVGLMEKEN